MSEIEMDYIGLEFTAQRIELLARLFGIHKCLRGLRLIDNRARSVIVAISYKVTRPLSRLITLILHAEEGNFMPKSAKTIGKSKVVRLASTLAPMKLIYKKDLHYATPSYKASVLWTTLFQS